MFYNKSYVLSDYLNKEDLDQLAYYTKTLLKLFENEVGIYTSMYSFFLYKDWADDQAHPFNNPNFFNTIFVYIEQIEAIEKSLMQLSYDFYQPPGYIKNRIWREIGETDVYKSFSYEDINRMITDMNILYEHRQDTPTIYNLYSNENWDGETTLEWE